MGYTIQRIETTGPDRRARRLVFTEDVESRTTSAAAVKELRLAEGSSVDLAALARAECPLARDRALNYLGYRERASHEVLKRLMDDGYPAATAAKIVDRFRELELVDDERFARMWARTRVSAGYGPRRIERELLSHGIDPDLAAKATVDSCDNVLESARAVLRGRTADTHAERQKLIARLVRRGFDLKVAVEVTSGDAPDSPPDVPFVGA